jgi:hypothetical protein
LASDSSWPTLLVKVNISLTVSKIVLLYLLASWRIKLYKSGLMDEMSKFQFSFQQMSLRCKRTLSCDSLQSVICNICQQWNILWWFYECWLIEEFAELLIPWFFGWFDLKIRPLHNAQCKKTTTKMCKKNHNGQDCFSIPNKIMNW